MQYKQRLHGEPYRADPHPDYVVVVQIVSLHRAMDGQQADEWREFVEETELAEVQRFAKLTEALLFAEKISDNIRLIGACDTCSGCGQLESTLLADLGDPLPYITCPDCDGEGR